MAAFAAWISLLPAALAQQQAGGDYQRYLDQYAGDYEKYIGSGGSAGGSGFTKYYQKYMQQYGDYTKYMNGGHAGDGYESFLGQYAGKFMSGDKAAGKAQAETQKPATPLSLASSHGGSGQKPSYMDFQRYLQGQGASRPSDFSHYMNQYAADYQKKHAQGTQAGDFSKFMDQYASDYQPYMQSQAPGGSQGSQGGGDFQQFMDFTKYMHGGQAPQGGASFSQYMDGYADFQKYMQGHGSSGDDFSKNYQQYIQQHGSQGGGGYQKYMDFQKYSDQGGDFSKFMAEYAGDYSKYTGQGSQTQGSQGGFSKYMKDYADYQKYMQGQGRQGGSGGDYMSQYASDYQKYVQGQSQGSQDYSKFMDQYANGYMGQSSVGTGDFKKYMDYQQYMRGQTSHTPDFSRYTSKFAADYDKYMQAPDREGHTNREGHGSSAHHQKSASNSANDTASPVVFAAGTHQPDLNSFMGNHDDYQQYLTTHGQGAPRGFQAFMGNYTDSLHKYMHARGSQAAGDFGKYFSDYQNYELNKGKQEAAGFQHYMKAYADDYSKYVQERGDSAADAKGKSGNFQKYIAQYAGNYQKYMQDQPSASGPSAPTLFASGTSAEPVPEQTQEQRENEKLQKEQQALHAELQAEQERLSTELKKEREQRREEKEHLRTELEAERKEQSQAAQPAQPAALAETAGSKLMSVSPLLVGLLMVAGGVRPAPKKNAAQTGSRRRLFDAAGSSIGSGLNPQLCDRCGVADLPERYHSGIFVNSAQLLPGPAVISGKSK
eukprot:CAMPEP_0181437216 /NCGR_PEP_ID=MMETSP1110-20121109/21260_1 /TAXON_ID=174948 /ORGANISM="Symbiodinium sp., Strain CCMP421" /LENGTH=769 /DNA_ID=CAMNT_0023560827 /DNA_START=72 /DNA_END=2377 /DNA_ORIENTATION=+